MTNKDKSIVEISIFTAIGNLKELEKSVNLGLDNELTVNEIKEDYGSTLCLLWIST